MRMIKTFVTVVALAAMSGCAPKVWVKPDGNEAKFAQDQAYCKMPAQQAEASTIAQNGFLAGYESAMAYKTCMEARGWTLMGKEAASETMRSQIVWVKSTPYSDVARNADLAACKELNPNADGVAPCMRARGYIGLTVGQLNDASRKAIAEGLVPKSVSSEQEDQMRKQKIIHMIIANQ